MQDPILSQVYSYTLNGWPILNDLYLTRSSHFPTKDFKSQLQTRVYFGVLESLFQRIFILRFYQVLHEGRPGMTKMKSLAHLHVWWPSIDDEIERFVKACRSYSQNARDPVRVPSSSAMAETSHRLCGILQGQDVAPSH